MCLLACSQTQRASMDAAKARSVAHSGKQVGQVVFLLATEHHSPAKQASLPDRGWCLGELDSYGRGESRTLVGISDSPPVPSRYQRQRPVFAATGE